jgi:hypothetical protein
LKHLPEISKIMNTAIIAKDLTKQAPHSPRGRVGGFAIASRAVDKCVRWKTCSSVSRESTAGNSKPPFRLPRIMKASEPGFKPTARKKTQAEIKTWSDANGAGSTIHDPERSAYFTENCTKLGLKPETSTTFDWLEADDRASFNRNSV